MEDFHRNNTEFKSLIVAVVRNEKVTIPPASFKFEPGDSVFFFVKLKMRKSQHTFGRPNF